MPIGEKTPGPSMFQPFFWKTLACGGLGILLTLLLIALMTFGDIKWFITLAPLSLLNGIFGAIWYLKSSFAFRQPPVKPQDPPEPQEASEPTPEPDEGRYGQCFKCRRGLNDYDAIFWADYKGNQYSTGYTQESWCWDCLVAAKAPRPYWAPPLGLGPSAAHHSTLGGFGDRGKGGDCR